MPITPPMTPLPHPVTAVVALEPVYNILMSISALHRPEDYGGLDDWVLQTASRMAPALREQHDLLFDWLWMDSLANAVERGSATESFPAYLAALAIQPPQVLRDRLFYWFLYSPHLRVGYEYRIVTPPAPAKLLADYDLFCTFITERVQGKIEEVQGVAAMHALFNQPAQLQTTLRVQGKIEEVQGVAAMHALFNQPAQLQTTLVTHLQTIWQEFLAVEWSRIQPKLQATVDAFQPIRLEGLSILEAMQSVTGRDLRPIYRLDALLTYQAVRFIPHLHIGPYVVWFGNHEELCIGFAAHQPPTSTARNRVFDLDTLTNRYKALADETRLAMLLALRREEELSTQEFIDQFALDKSAASRHLRQLVATSLLEERRLDGAKKVYRVNKKAVDELIEFLTGLG